MSRRWLLLAALLASGPGSPATGAETLHPPGLAASYETPRLSAAELLRPELLRGTGYEIAERVVIEGDRAVFHIASAHGSLRVTGLELLAVRLSEFEAIQVLGRINKGEAFLAALGKAAKAPVALVGNLIDNPGGTLDRVASGIGRMWDRVGGLVRSGVAAVTEPGDDTGASAGESPPPAFGNDPFGYNKARRQWAKSLKIDPYTSNPMLKGLLDDAAAATFAGHLAVDTTLGMVAAPVNLAVGLERESQDALWDLAPAEVARRNEARLESLGIGEEKRRALLRNRWLTPTLQTALVDALEDLTGVAGLDELVGAGARTRGEAAVRALTYAIDLMGRHRGAGASLLRLRTDAGLVVADSADGRVVLASAADYLYWNPALADLVARYGGHPRPPVLLCTAAISAKARERLAAAGWKIVVEHPGRQ